MQPLSYPSHVVPKLTLDCLDLKDDLLEKIHAEQVARPAGYTSKIFWDVIEVVSDILGSLESFDQISGDRKHRTALRLVEILMLRCSSLNEYLGRLLTICAPADQSGLKQARDAMSVCLGQGIKVPINKIKHNGFSLAPIVLTNGVAQVLGFVVYGPLENGVSGPLSHSKKHGGGTPEGYSLPLFMRTVIAMIFRMTDIASKRLSEWGSYELGKVTSQKLNPNTARVMELPNILDRLNSLPFHGFMGEHNQRAPRFSVVDGTLNMQMARVHRLRGRVSVHFQVTSVSGQEQLPYWKG